MRALFPLLLLVACSEATPPHVELAGIDPEAVKPPRMICSQDGQEALIYELSDGTITDPIPTNRSCDYERYRSYRESHGDYPPGEWRMQTYEEWRAARERES